MVKQSSTHKTKKSDHSLHSTLSKQKMNPSSSTHKRKMRKKKNKSKTKENIQKLFQQLRNDSDTPSNNSQTTVISLDSSYNETVISRPQTPTKKRKITSTVENDTKRQRKKNNSSVIIITDDEPVTDKIQPNIDCSTPVRLKDKEAMRHLIVDNFCHSRTNNNLSSVQNFNEDTNVTKDLNMDSYLTIDLTTDSLFKKHNPNTVIDVDSNIETQDCTIVSVSEANLSMSRDSEVTVLSTQKTNSKEMKKFANGIDKLNSTQKGQLLEYIAQKIFTGCNVPKKLKNSLSNIKQSMSRATETAEDTYIKEVILGETPSRNSVGSNVYRPSKDPANKTGLRMIVIDGSNVAMDHTKGRIFSVEGLKICIDYFLRRGHVVKAFVPRFRCKFGKSSDPRLLDSLERRGLVVYTPSREIQGKTIVPYDDRYIVQCAAEFDGVIISGDNYRDLMLENPRWKFVIENRLLQFTWVNDMIMFPRDPLGRNGPTLEQFLKHPNKAPSIVL